MKKLQNNLCQDCLDKVCESLTYYGIEESAVPLAVIDFDTLDADIYSFDDGSLHLCSYEETESYQVTEMFINNRKALLNRLLED